MKEIRIKCPAKINLTLEIVNKREDGFHNIKSVMQLIDLYDILTVSAENNSENSITLSGNSSEIPYDKSNLVYKAAELFLKNPKIKGLYQIHINIEKNIPVSAGLAGGSTDAAGTLYGLNKIFNNILSTDELHLLCSSLGSDLNVCLKGGCLLATSRGEIIEPLPNISYPVSVIKPKKLGISAKEAYTKYSLKTIKPKLNKTEQIIAAIKSNSDITPFLYNDLEYAVFDDYKELQMIKAEFPQAVMSGSGSAYFLLNKVNKQNLSDDFQIINNLNFIKTGVREYKV